MSEPERIDPETGRQRPRGRHRAWILAGIALSLVGVWLEVRDAGDGLGETLIWMGLGAASVFLFAWATRPRKASGEPPRR